MSNPMVPAGWSDHNLLITLGLLALLGGVFLRGFGEAIGIAVVLVAVYLTLNVAVVAVGLEHVASAPGLVGDWRAALTTTYSSPWMMIGIALLVFPKLALGLSGFETGVAVMPQIAGDPADTDDEPEGRIRGTRRLLTTTAVMMMMMMMSVFLITPSVITTALIPQPEFQPGGAANGRALAYLAHEYLGPAFGSVYDISTITILWFVAAVANSIAALLLHLRDEYHVHPSVYFEWTEGNPVRHFLRFLFLGVGEIAPTTREVQRRAEPETIRRPRVYVG